MDKAVRTGRNARKLAELDVVIARKARAVIADMEGQGWQPLIVEAGRDPIDQARKYYSGYSKVLWGFHCAEDEDGNPEALAFDVVDARYQWNVKRYAAKIRDYIHDLVSSCAAHSLRNGSVWKSFGPWGDFAHCEVTGISLSQAKKGMRPV